MESLTTEHHTVDRSSPPYIIAEIGLNHNGELDRALRLVEAAATCGVHAAKFQLYNSEEFIHESAALGDGGPGSLRAFFSQFELRPEDWVTLAKHTRDQGLDFFCSVFDHPSLEFYRELKPRVLKIASTDVNYRPMFDAAIANGWAIIFSTGASNEAEVERAALWCEGHPHAILQCASVYPAAPANYNLRVVPGWLERFDCPVGISDHCPDNAVSLAAVALGGTIIERHFTLSREWPGPDQALSLEPEHMRALVRDAASVFESLGDGVKRALPDEEGVRKYGRRAYYAARELPAGESITSETLIAQRPGGPLSVDRFADQLSEQKLKRPLRKGEMLEESHVDG